MGRRREGRLAPSREGAGQEKWSTAGKEMNGPTDEVGALERTEVCQDLGRGETGTVEREWPGQRHLHKEKPREKELGWMGWEERESGYGRGGKTGEEKEASSAAEISSCRMN